jgi:dynamin 1-like protein
MDKGTNAKRMLLGQEVPLRLGYVAIKNRSQQDINENITVRQALEVERQYFESSEHYGDIAKTHTGTGILSEKLTKILFTHIKQFLPDIMREITLKLRECEERMRELGPSAPTENKDKMQVLWNMITDFCEIYKNTIRGKYDRRRSTKITKDL